MNEHLRVIIPLEMMKEFIGSRKHSHMNNKFKMTNLIQQLFLIRAQQQPARPISILFLEFPWHHSKHTFKFLRRFCSKYFLPFIKIFFSFHIFPLKHRKSRQAEKHKKYFINSEVKHRRRKDIEFFK